MQSTEFSCSSVPSVGAITAYAFLTTINDPTRFAHPRSMGAYVGLTSKLPVG